MAAVCAARDADVRGRQAERGRARAADRTKPWTVRVNQRLMPDAELIEFICAENQKFDQYLRGDLRPTP